MGKSTVLDKAYYNFQDDNSLTDIVEDNKKIDIYNNAVKRYSFETKSYPNGVTYNNPENLDSKHPVFELPKIPNFLDNVNSKKFSKRIQSWKGVIISYTDKTFSAKLYDLNAGGTFEIGEFEKEDISPDDLSLLSDGAIFYWSVGHYMENGQSVKRSDIRFQRLITLDENDIDNTKLNIERKYANLKERKIDNK